jgi:hypothetical protein
MLGESECVCPCVFSECCSWEWDSGGGGGAMGGVGRGGGRYFRVWDSISVA